MLRLRNVVLPIDGSEDSKTGFAIMTLVTLTFTARALGGS